MAGSITFFWNARVVHMCRFPASHQPPHAAALGTGLVFQRPQVWGIRLSSLSSTTYLASLLPCCSTPKNVVAQCPVLAGIFVFGRWILTQKLLPLPRATFLLPAPLPLPLPAWSQLTASSRTQHQAAFSWPTTLAKFCVFARYSKPSFFSFSRRACFSRHTLKTVT